MDNGTDGPTEGLTDKRNGRTGRQTDRRTDGRTDNIGHLRNHPIETFISFQDHHLKRHLSSQCDDRGNFSRPIKRRRLSAGIGRGGGSLNHLSGEMIRKLREQQKVKAQATAAAAVAVAVANAASHKSSSAARIRQDSGKSTIVTPVTTVTQPPPLMSTRDNSSSEVFDARLNGQLIPAFNIGGEFRLCLPQILRQILGPFHWEQVRITLRPVL